MFRSSECVIQNLEVKISFNLPFLRNELEKTIIKGKNTCNDIQKSNKNLFGQVAVLNCQKSQSGFGKLLKYINYGL